MDKKILAVSFLQLVISSLINWKQYKLTVTIVRTTIWRMCEVREFVKTLRQYKIIRELQEVPWKSKDVSKQH